jgi:hypothetical protein
MTQHELQLLREYRKLSSDGKAELLEYLQWLRDMENRITLKGFKPPDLRETAFLRTEKAHLADS